MAKKRSARVLFFTQDAKPSESEYRLADLLGSNVAFRNGRIARSIKAEICDAVAAVKGSLIPAIYAENNVPRVKTAEEVARLKPGFMQTIGYADEDDDGYAGPKASSLPDPTITTTDLAGEPQVGQSGEGQQSDNTGSPNSDGDGQQPEQQPPVTPPEQQTPPATPAPAGRGRKPAAAPAPAATLPEQQPPANPPAAASPPPAWGNPPPADNGQQT